MGETTIARLFTPTERSKVDRPKIGEQMNAGAECRVPVCRLLNHVVAAIFFFFFFFFNQYYHLKWHTCVKHMIKRGFATTVVTNSHRLDLTF